MSKISELGPITGANTRSEDLFVIVNLIQGDDGTKNITRRELVQAIQYEEFNRITITGGSISNVNMFNSTLSGVTINDSIYNRGTINDSELNNVTINSAVAEDVTMTDSAISDSSFNDGTANNVTLTQSAFNNGTLETVSGNNVTLVNSTIDDSDFSNGTGNNNVFTNTRIENIEIEGGTANNLVITNLTLDEVVMTDVEISRGTIDTVDISNSNITDTDLDDVDITNSRFSNGVIWDTRIANSTATSLGISGSTFDNGNISDSFANNIQITSSTANNLDITNGNITQVQITDSDFSNGTGNNNVFTNTTLETATVNEGTFANSSFQGSMNDVVAQNMTITSSSTEDMNSANTNMTRSSFDGGVITNSDIKDGTIRQVELSNSIITDSQLVDFDISLGSKFDPGIAENSYFVVKNEKTGETEQISYGQLVDELGMTMEKALKVHVASDGDDNNPGSMLKPVRTLARASQLAIEKAGGDVNRNDINNAVHISVGPGTYYVDEPIVLPDDCALTSTAGQYATVIQKKPGWERTNGILVGSGCYVQGFAYMNFEVDNFDNPEGGFAIAYRPGALMRRSPYIRDSSQLSNFNRLDVEPPLNPFNSKGTIADLGQEFYLEAGHSAQAQFEVDDEVTFSSGARGYISYIDDIDSNSQIYVRNLKGNVEPGDILYAQRGGTGTVDRLGIDDFPNRLVGRGGGCVLCDRALLDTDSLYTYLLCFGFTPRTQNGTGYVAKNGAGVNGIGSLSIFTRQAFFALDGGQVTLNNSGSQFGDISMRAKGKTTIVQPAAANQNNIISNTVFADDISEQSQEIVTDMVEYLTSNTTSGGLGYQGYNADKCFRDTGIIVDNIGLDVATNSNYWGRLNGITYRSPISYVVINEQLTETVGSIEHLKEGVNFIFENANNEVNDRVNKSLNETLNILQNGEEFANNIVFADTGVGPRTGAREVVQDNREFIIEEFIDWLDNNPNFFAYDSAKCKRDVREFILPAVKYDSLLDTNYNSVTAGNAYYFKAAKNVIGAQRDETISAYERLRYSTDKIVEANSAPMAADAYNKFNEILSILKQDGTRYTPTAATYAPDGTFTITIGQHDLEVGRYILLMPESFTFTCDTDGNQVELVHPRKSDPAFKSALPILSRTGTTITVNVGATGYKGTHTLKSVLDGAVIELGSAITFSDDAAIPVNRRNARKQLQANKDYIQDYMMGWADNEWFFYDSKKCQRDMKEYIVPAVMRDMQLGTNFNSIQSGQSYRGATAAVTINDQLPETVGAIEHLKLETVSTLGDSIAQDRATRAYNEIINIMSPGGRQYTPTDADYNPATGVMTLTLNNHTFEIGDQVQFDENAITFSCANTATGVVTEISHPRPTDPIYRSPVSITGATSTTITMNVGAIPNGYTGVHTFVRAKLNGVKEYGIHNGRFTPTDAEYFSNSGIMTVTIGDHDLRIGDTIQIEAGAMTFSCANSSGTFEISHPRATDPAFETDLVVTAVTANTITVNVGDSGTYTAAQSFVYAEPDAIKVTTVYNGKFTPQDASYDPISGDMTLDIGQHNLPVGKWIQLADSSITFSCANTANAAIVTEITHPRVGEPAYRQPVRITAATGTSITVNVGNANGYKQDHTFVSATTDCVDTNAIYWTDAAKIHSLHTPSTATYAPDTGVMEITLGANHGFTTDDHIEFKPQSFVFSCANGAVVTEISHPRIGEPNYQKPLAITAVSNTTITVNTGAVPNGYANNHTFVSAEEGSVMKMRPEVTRDGLNASEQVLNNKVFLQNEVDAWLANNYFVYDSSRCSRDTGYILDAVRRDMLTDSNVNAVFAGLAYRTGNASANTVINEQLTETVGAITWLKNEIATNITSGTGQTRANAAFDEIIDIMQNGVANAAIRTFGTDSVSDDALAARKALQANKTMLQKEVTSWIANTHPDLVYDVADCERDLGYFVDAVSWDVQHGSNAATLSNARVYFDNMVSVLAQAEKPVTAEAYEHIANIAGQVVREEIATLQTPQAQVFNASNNELTPTDASYDPVTGLMTVTVNGHGMETGDWVVMEEGAITFSCSNTTVANTQISHPRATDPYFNTPCEIIASDTNTFTLDVGDAKGYTGVHTYVRTNGVFRPSVGPDISEEVVRLFRTVSDIIEEDSYKETFGTEGYTDTDGYVSAGPGYGTDGKDTGLTNPSFKEPTGGYNSDIQAQYEEIAGSTGKYQYEIIDYIREQYKGLGYTDISKCQRDVGYIVDAIAEDLEYGGNAATANAARFYFEGAINVLPYYQREPTRLAFEHLASVVENIVTETTVTPTSGNTVAQDKTGTAGSATVATRAKNLVNDISAVVDDRLVIPELGGSLDISEGQQTPRDRLPKANTAISPIIEPSRTYARRSLQKNKNFIQDEVIAYINDEYFVYDEDKCERDVGYIVDAVRRDVQTGGNYHGIYTGRAYRAGTTNTDKVIEEQLAETIEAIKYIRDDITPRLSGVALTTAQASFNNIIGIMKDGVASAPAYNYGTAFQNVSAQNCEAGLNLNRDFMKAEAIAWLATNYPSLTYDTAKCRRDVGYMIDAVSFDIIHDTNVAVRDVARLYFEEGISTLPAAQRIPTAGLWDRLGEVAEQIVLKQVVSKSLSNAENQVTAGFTAAVAAQASDLPGLFGIVADLIREDSLINLPNAIEPYTTQTHQGGTGYDYSVEASIIGARKTTLAAGINDYLQEKFDYLEYDQSKCRRDTGYIVDAISHDIQYGGNAAMWNAAQIYFVNAVNLLPKEQREPTKKAFTHMAHIVHDIIRNESITKTEGNNFNQDTTNLAGRREIAMEAKNLALMIADITDDNSPENLPARVEPNTNWVPQVLITEKDKVDNNLEALVTSMINFISSEYKGISYPKEKCRRDVGIIVDALSHDTQYWTNHATRLSANMYFDNATSVLPFDQRTQTADFYDKMADLVSLIIQGDTPTDAYTDTARVAQTAATATEGEWAADLVRVIEEAIRRDGLDAVPELVEPDTSWVDVSKVWAADEIDDNLDFLADDVVQHIKDNFTIVDYSKAKCRRDSGYIIDAISWDLNYGGNLASRWNADFYYWNNELRIPENTRVATAQSYRRLGEIIRDVVTGSYPGQKLRPEMGDEERAKQAYDNGMIFYNALYFNSPKYLGPTIEADFTWEDDRSKMFRFSKDILADNKTKLQREVQRFITSEYKFIDLPKTYRDGNNFLTFIQNDLRFVDPSVNITGEYNVAGAGGDKSSRAFAAALFNIDSQHVFPVFNPPRTFSDWRRLRFKGTVATTVDRDALTGMKRWDAYIVPTNNNGNRYDGTIYYWTGVAWGTVGANNIDLLESFYLAWERMRDYINNNIAPDAEHRSMITELIDNVIIDTVLRPNFLGFGSLVESIAHQFNGASAGVNRNALPLNFRNVGSAISATASVLSEDGGRIRWSGADELNNQYFARGLRINGRTGRIEGRPFTSSVRKLARRASNSRATI